MKHKAYLIRVEGEEENLISEIITSEKEKNFIAANNAIEKMTEKSKRRGSAFEVDRSALLNFNLISLKEKPRQ